MFGAVVFLGASASFWFFQSEEYKNLVARDRERVTMEAKSYCGSLFENVIEDEFQSDYKEDVVEMKDEEETKEESEESEVEDEDDLGEDETKEDDLPVPLTGGGIDESKVVRWDVSEEELLSCLNKLDDIFDQIDTINLRSEIAEAKRFLELRDLINSKFDDDGVFLENVAESEIIEIENELETFPKGYRKRGTEEVSLVRTEFEKVKQAKERTLGLFDEGANVNKLASATVKASVSREELDGAKAAIEALSQKKLKKKLSSELGRVEEQVVENERRAEEERRERERIYRERLEAERRRQAAIAAAWSTIDVPYIAQNTSGVNNGCEAASLLMALNYKGYLVGKSLYDYANEMPKSDDPSTGFYLDIFGSEPKTEAHWIAPAPLAEFGRNSSGYQGVYDMSGSSIETLRDEMLAGNPVIIYLTFNFQNPVNYSRGVPSNLHVMVLTGYNSMTGDYRVTDPWYRNGQSNFFLSGSRIATLYAQVGYRAVVVK